MQPQTGGGQLDTEGFDLPATNNHSEGKMKQIKEIEMNVKLDKAVKSEISYLLNAAMVRLNDDEHENMAWRLADAGGLLREALPTRAGESLIGRDEPTGRGYVLPVADVDQTSGVVKIEVIKVYGNDTIYPKNSAAERFAAIAGKKTFSSQDLANIKALGFTVEEVAAKKLVA